MSTNLPSSPESRHSRSLSGNSLVRSPSPPSQTFHSSGLLPKSLPTPALVESVAGGAHYSGAKVDPHSVIKHRHPSGSGDKHEEEVHTEATADHSRIMGDLSELFGCRPTLEIFERTWSKDAAFEDPLSVCKGYAEYAPQWFAMPKVFASSKTLSTRVMSSTNSPNRLVYEQKQEYTFRLLGYKKVVDSIVVVDFDEDNRIIKLLDQWDGKLPTRFGSLFLRRANAKVVSWLVRVPRP
ncbi:hypothetical protein C8J56DRAFT_959113 [Mycena floridula]|nr:hypothetical protein C8J56DRAFT_959113 [Mycena floridula]